MQPLLGYPSASEDFTRLWTASDRSRGESVRENFDLSDSREECPPWVADLRAMARRLDECEKELAELHAKISSRRAEIEHMRSLNETIAPSPQPISWPPLQIPTPSPWATPAPYPRCLGCAGARPPAARLTRANPARRA